MISICNGFLMASFDAKSGDWVSLRRTDGTQLLGRPGLSCQVFIDRQPFPASPFPDQRQRKLSQCELTDDGRGCRMIFESEGLRVTQTITLDAKDAVLRQSVRIACIAGTGPRLLSGIHYFLPGFVVGQPAQCKLQAPSQHIAPDMSYEQAAALALDRRVDQPKLALFGACVAFCDVRTAAPQRLYLGADKLNAGLHGFFDHVIETRAAIFRDQFALGIRFLGHDS